MSDEKVESGVKVAISLNCNEETEGFIRATLDEVQESHVHIERLQADLGMCTHERESYRVRMIELDDLRIKLQADLATAEAEIEAAIEAAKNFDAAEYCKAAIPLAEQRGREAEREACAMLAGNIYPDSDWPLAANFAIRDRIARAIRTRGKVE